MSNKDKILKIIFDLFSVGGWNGIHKPADIKRNHSLRDDLCGDSLDEVELIMCLEGEFDCEIEDADAENMKTVGDILDYAEKHFNS